MMITVVRRVTLACAVFVFSLPLLAAQPWDGAPLSGDPKAILAAAEATPAGDSDLIVLLDETHHTFDEKGHDVEVQRYIYRIVAESAIDGWGTVNAPWAPWYQERPEIQARVITKDGTVHMLDPHAITEAPAPEESLDIFSDNRVIRAPLPAIAAGSVVEQVITYPAKSSLFDAGTSDIFFFGSFKPVQRSRLVIDAPASLPLKFVNRSAPLIEPVKEEKDGRQHIVFEGGPYAAKEDIEWNLPYDVAPLPWIGLSTGTSWQDMATRYSQTVDKQIADAGLDKIVREAVGNTKDRREIITRSLAWIQKHVRYAGVEVGESSVIPRPPQIVLGNRYGDCKDKATLLVAMLRQSGIAAHVALLRAGDDFDVHQELPGMGRFNHAIVVVDAEKAGDAPMWVDPTDEYARAGELPMMDQGRLALIANPTSTALTLTPAYDGTANRVVETRIFKLPEEGKATVSEITEASGADESAIRRYYVSADRKKYREQMEEYAKATYNAKELKNLDTTDPHDLSKPFRMTIDVNDAQRGISSDGEAAVAIFPSSFAEALPWTLRTYEEKKPDDPKPRKVRKNDFVFARPFVKEWHYRIVPPAGFVARTLPQNETTQYGSVTVTREYSTDADGAVLANFKFDSGKRRLTASEFEATQKAVKELQESKMILVGFDQIGQQKLNTGDIGGALTEFRKLAALHPKEGQHQTEIAKALLAGGMADAAREQIKKAIALDPKYARAYRMQGIILEHDLLGRPLRKGFDLAGAIAAYKKARELDPKEESTRAELAKLLEVGEEGLLFGKNAKVDEAIDEYIALIKDLDQKEYEPELFNALAHAQRYTALADAIKTAQVPAQRNIWRVFLAATTQGSKAAVAEAAKLDQSDRKEALRTAAGVLITMRMYPLAADLIEEATQGSPSADARNQIETLRKAKHYEDIELPANDPKSIVKRLVIAGSLDGISAEVAKEYFTADEWKFFESESAQREQKMAHVALLNIARQQNLPLAFYADIGLGQTTFTQDGDDEIGYRVRARSATTHGDDETAFVVKDGDRYRISATDKVPSLIGFSVLRLLDAGKTEAARQWLNWARDEYPSGGGDDTLASSPFSKYWPKSKATATPDEIRLAAALLMPSKEMSDRALPILLAAREKSTSDDEKLRIDHALAIIYAVKEDDANAAKVAERLLAAQPDSAVAFNMLSSVYTRLGRFSDTEKISKERLARFDKDDDALRVLGGAAMEQGDYASSDKYYRQIIDELRPTADDYNNIAWNALLSGHNLDNALEDARRAMQLPGAGSALLHTVASLYAETGKSLEAREALLQSMDTAGREDPAPHDWYVLGRIAENYGAKDAAVAAYKKVEKPKTSIASSTYLLAERRMKAMK
ncbi:MAG TPA: DUF3857 domain-containing protein [Thermoanaerobaculia bacterium]|nr:DUF3857 domain-containing protein [Thermoanaerobaculia bacterium]